MRAEDRNGERLRAHGQNGLENRRLLYKIFYGLLKLLNIIPADKYTKATDYIKEQIEMVKCLDDKGFTYVTSDGLYF